MTNSRSVDDAFTESQVLLAFISGIVLAILLGIFGALLMVLPHLRRNRLPADELERRAINYLELRAAEDGQVAMDVELDFLAA